MGMIALVQNGFSLRTVTDRPTVATFPCTAKVGEAVINHVEFVDTLFMSDWNSTCLLQVVCFKADVFKRKQSSTRSYVCDKSYSEP